MTLPPRKQLLPIVAACAAGAAAEENFNKEYFNIPYFNKETRILFYNVNIHS